MTVMKDLLQLQNTYIVTDTHARLLEMLSHLKTFVIISVKTKFRLILIFLKHKFPWFCLTYQTCQNSSLIGSFMTHSLIVHCSGAHSGSASLMQLIVFYISKSKTYNFNTKVGKINEFQSYVKVNMKKTVIAYKTNPMLIKLRNSINNTLETWKMCRYAFQSLLLQNMLTVFLSCSYVIQRTIFQETILIQLAVNPGQIFQSLNLEIFCGTHLYKMPLLLLVSLFSTHSE